MLQRLDLKHQKIFRKICKDKKKTQVQVLAALIEIYKDYPHLIDKYFK